MTNEEIAKAAYDAGFSSSEIFKRLAAFKLMIDSAAAAEREQCADICKGYTNGNHDNLADLCEMDIRARGNHASR